MDSSVRRYLRYYTAPVLCAVFVILSFCGFGSIGLILGFLAILFFWRRFQNGIKQQSHLLDFVVLGLLSLEIIAGLFNNQGIYAKTYLFSLFFNVLVYFILRIFLRKEKQEVLFTNILAGFVILLAILSIGSFYFFKFNIEYEGFTDLVNFKSKFTPLGFLLNDWATILLLSSSFVLLALAHSRFNTPWFWALFAGLGAVLMGIVFSFSRGAYLSVLLGLLVFFGVGLLFRVVQFEKLLLFFAGTVLMVALTALPVRKEFITTMGLSGTTSQVRSTSGRVELWKAAFQIIREEPISGVGNDQFSMRANPYLAQNEDASVSGRATNSYLQILVEKGIIGFIPWAVFIGLLSLTLFRLIKKRDSNNLPALTVFAVFIAVLFRELSFSTFFEKDQMQLLFFVFAAFIVNWDKTKNKSYSFPRYSLPIFLSLIFLLLASFHVLYKIAAKKNDTFIGKVQEGEYRNAMEAIDKAIRYDPRNPLLNANKGFLLNTIQQKDSTHQDSNENSLAYYRMAVTHSPYDPWLRHNLAWLYLNEGKTDSADIHFRKVCELSTNTALFHVSRGLFQNKTGTADLGLTEFKKSIRLSPDLLDSEFAKDLEVKNQEWFRNTLNELIDSLSLKTKTDDSPIIKSRLAKIILHTGDTVRAMQLFGQAGKQLPNLDRPWYYQGMVKLAQNDTATFLQYLNRAILLDPRDSHYSLALGDYYHSLNQKRDAIYYYKNALFNHANLYTQHAMIAPKWYGYKTLPNTILLVGLLQSISPSFDKITVCSRLIKLYNELEQKRESNLIERYQNNSIPIGSLFKELNKKVIF
ncbi:MAG: O-antigen ligase family protein [Bacteroidota bacterium]|nr:O-antigen ligase family protein [Bacteroidota bacterium]